MEWEANLIEQLQNGLGDLCTTFGKVFAFVGGEMGLLVLVIIVMFCWRKEVGQKLVLMVASLLAWFGMIKAVAMRPRPYAEHPDKVKALALVNTEAPATDVVAQGFSFPSMHSGSVAAAYITIAREVKKKWFWVVAIALMLLVGFSRIVTGNHYPTDVLAGWLLGFAVIGVFELLERYVKKEWVRHLILLVTILPGLFFVRTDDYFTAFGLLVGTIAAIPFERKFADFQDTRNVWAMILRVVGAIAIYFVLNSLLKMPFSPDFLASGALSALLVRSGRYAIIIFVIMGVYPKVFPLFERLGGKGAKNRA